MSTARSEPLSLAGLPWPVEVRVHPRARAVRLRIDEQRQLITLTCPRRSSRRAALAWAQAQREWIEQRLAGLEPRVAIAPGVTIPLDGEDCLLLWDPALPRQVRVESGQIRVGGPVEGFARRVARWLRGEALRLLSAETADLASVAGVTLAGVSVGDPGTRWGSCSGNGRIRYSWRLLLAPPELRRYVVAHEVAHRLHMNHGAEFHALEERLFGASVAPARLALRRLGPRLKRIDLPR